MVEKEKKEKRNLTKGMDWKKVSQRFTKNITQPTSRFKSFTTCG